MPLRLETARRTLTHDMEPWSERSGIGVVSGPVVKAIEGETMAGAATGFTGRSASLRAVNDVGRHLAPHRASLSSAIEKVLDSGQLVLGSQVRQFEESFAGYCRSEHCVCVASGTDALEIALRAVDVGAGDEVITVANAGMYGSAAVLAIGAVPRYVEIDPRDLLMDLDRLQTALDRPNHRPAAVIVTHLYGQAVDMIRVMSVAAPRGVAVVEDCAQAHGATFGGRPCGSWGDAAAFSFYPTKNLGALGDAGVVVTNSADIAGKARELRQYGWSAKYVATRPGGRNSRMDELQASVLNVLLPRLDGWNEQRRRIVARYSEELRHDRLVVPRRGSLGDVGHLFVVRARERDGLRGHLTDNGIGSEVHYPVPDHRQPAVRAVTGSPVSLPLTEAACDEVVSLPCFPEMTDAEIQRVIDAVRMW